MFTWIDWKGILLFNGKETIYSISCHTCFPTSNFDEIAQRYVNSFESAYLKRNMNAEEVSSSISSRRKNFHALWITFVENNVQVIPLGGKDYETYNEDMNRGIRARESAAGKLLISTGATHVFRAYNGKLAEGYSIRNDPKEYRAKNLNDSTDMLNLYGGVGLRLRYVGKEEQRPKNWKEIEIDTARFDKIGTYKYKSDDYEIDVWQGVY